MKYYILYNDENKGPLELPELEQFGLNPSSRLWAPGWPSWKDASEVEEVATYLKEKEDRLSRTETEPAKTPACPTNIPSSPQAGTSTIKDPDRDPDGPSQHSQPDIPPAPPVAGTATYPPAPAGPQQVEWYLGINNRETGPFREEQLVNAGLRRDTMVWCESMPTWAPAHTVPELAYLLPQPYQQQQPVQDNTIGYMPDINVMQYDVANPWLTTIIGIGLFILALVLAIITASRLIVSISLVAGTMSAELVLLFCGIISASRVSVAKDSGRYVLAGRRSGAARAWGWTSIILALALCIAYSVILAASI